MKCALCRHSKFTRLFFFLNPRAIGPREFGYFRCNHCYLVCLYPALSSQILNRIYSDLEYFAKLCQSTESGLRDRLLSIRFFPEYHEYVELNSKNKGELLDVGCGNGEFLEIMKKRGWKVNGIDASKEAVTNSKLRLEKQAVIKIGPVRPGIFRKKFDVICMWHVLEHVPNPVAFVSTLSGLLKPNGKLIFEVPNASSILFNAFKNDYNWLMVPEHIFYYSASSLSYLLRKGKMKIIRKDYPPRALLNFSLSIEKIVSKHSHKTFGKLFLFLTFPISIIYGFLAALMGKGEVLRIVATHDGKN